uniref:Uncharacterized protein n=1 Tax=Lotharella oceanica TaxID=641309 RepID=A0A7S2TFL0_9EUKA|eukprot:CAMPEP_0170172908 /NCGR_PEP_ID=MMETSP0040_2-20121228/6168_1 /TAXON_ID=641309 /ORGANISM="Lotharella oceanica, Strain CCMP622" /LENGTH=150 /DNA_ID=CAMNT_0010413803 /DNA_START=67 /DNA_END=519 /DNA_ORIENTATION=-
MEKEPYRARDVSAPTPPVGGHTCNRKIGDKKMKYHIVKRISNIFEEETVESTEVLKGFYEDPWSCNKECKRKLNNFIATFAEDFDPIGISYDTTVEDPMCIKYVYKGTKQKQGVRFGLVAEFFSTPESSPIPGSRKIQRPSKKHTATKSS